MTEMLELSDEDLKHSVYKCFTEQVWLCLKQIKIESLIKEGIKKNEMKILDLKIAMM